MAVLFVVIDAYEHELYINYQNRKAEYVDKFADHVDWNEINMRYSAV